MTSLSYLGEQKLQTSVNGGQESHQRLWRYFLKNSLFITKEASGASVRSMACVQLSSCWETKILEQALG